MTELPQAQVDTLLAAIKLLTVFAGFYIVYLGFRAYQKTKQRHILYLTLGMLVLTVGAISEGLALQGLGWSLNNSHIFEAIFTFVGFLVLVYSLIAK